MVEMPKDPLEPPKFKYQKAPPVPGSPPVPVLHSPPKKLSKGMHSVAIENLFLFLFSSSSFCSFYVSLSCFLCYFSSCFFFLLDFVLFVCLFLCFVLFVLFLTLLDERDSWKIPPCISNWKNPKGFIISLDKRLATDGRDLQENTISDSFAYFSDGMCFSSSGSVSSCLCSMPGFCACSCSCEFSFSAVYSRRSSYAVALNIAEQKAREEVTKRLNINRELEIQRQKEREEELARIAEEARTQRAQIAQVGLLSHSSYSS
jgi:hypothetical protein